MPVAAPGGSILRSLVPAAGRRPAEKVPPPSLRPRPSGFGDASARRRDRCSSVAQRQSIRLLTGGLLVRIQPEEPIQ